MTSLNIPQYLEISSYLLKQCKLWVWDFDDTLINSETYIIKNMNPVEISQRTDTELDIEIPQWKYFRKLVEYLVSHGRYVSIASFGTYEIIQAYMNRIMGFNQKIFTKKNIIAPTITARDVYRYSLPPNKNEYIYTLMRIYRVQDFKQVVLFDDKPSNIADAVAIGVIGIQIASPTNGDKIGDMYFGPWVMSKFDNKIKTTCGDEIYLNRTFTGFAKNENYIGDDEINFGTGVRATNNYFMENYDLYTSPAFGTGIGDRKILKKPQYTWNKYNNNIQTPQWYNGNYLPIPTPVENPTPSENPTPVENPKSLEKFTNNIENCYDCNKFEFNWIILLLILLFFSMIIISYKC